MRCEDCQFEWGSLPTERVAPTIGDLAGRWAEALTQPHDVLARRPAPEVWSALEYACHVRDVLLVMCERVLLALRSPSPPTFVPMGRDERVVHDRYAEQAPADVARQLVDAASMLAFVFEGLDERQWEMRGVYNYPVEAERTVSWLGHQAVHELAHHLTDLRASIDGSPGHA